MENKKGIEKEKQESTKEGKNLTSQKGITLIALIITIIVMLILVAVTVTTVVNSGLFGKAGEAAERWKEEQEKEIALGQNLGDIVNQYTNGAGNTPSPGLPENTPTTAAGTEVKLPDNWYSTSTVYVSTEDGSIVKQAVRVANVTAVAVGEGETVPVPQGFYYVGGTISSGVVISDDARDRNKYAGIEDVPAGAVYNSDGTVKTYTEDDYNALSEEEKKEVLLGNQFVWIPVTASEYAKTNWGLANATWETQTNLAELPYIQKYEGFYIGRYEAGTSQITLSTGVDFAAANTASTESWINDNFSIREGLGHTATGNVTSKAGEIPYYHVDYFTAVKLSNSMYNTAYVKSGLVTGTMWDAMMRFITNGDNMVVTASTWGHYKNTSGNVSTESGKGRYGAVNSSTGATSAFTVNDGVYHYGMKTTGITEDVKKKNLYDVAGNLWEWTQEAAYPNNTIESYMLRGGRLQQQLLRRPSLLPRLPPSGFHSHERRVPPSTLHNVDKGTEFLSEAF